MNLRKAAVSTLAGLFLISGTAACGSREHNYNLECDRGDQGEHDSDCGYVDASGAWQWYSWVKLGDVSHSPDGWEPPEGVEIAQEDEEPKTPKKKSKKKH